MGGGMYIDKKSSQNSSGKYMKDSAIFHPSNSTNVTPSSLAFKK
jgi:hypothetical protein